jgi:hypothetical protein
LTCGTDRLVITPCVRVHVSLFTNPTLPVPFALQNPPFLSHPSSRKFRSSVEEVKRILGLVFAATYKLHVISRSVLPSDSNISLGLGASSRLLVVLLFYAKWTDGGKDVVSLKKATPLSGGSRR